MYVGQTIDIDERWKGHQKKNSNCLYLRHAFEKHGIDNFKFELICICFDEDMNDYEVDYMRKYNTLVPHGYNLREPGNSGKHHEETKAKISKSLMGRTINLTPPQLGKPHTEEEKKKISDAMKGKTVSTEAVKKFIAWRKSKAKPVVQLDLEGNFLKRFESSVQASGVIKKTRGAIHVACKRDRLSGGYKWMYENDYINLMKNT